MKLSSAYLGHHGLVAGMFDELGIGSIIDENLPKQGQHKLPHSIIVKAMIINTLGFNERRLYIFPEFFKNVDNNIATGRRPVNVPLAPGLASSIPFCAPLTETLSSVISPGMQVLAMTWRWIDEGGTFWPLIATVQEGGPRSRWRHKIR